METDREDDEFELEHRDCDTTELKYRDGEVHIEEAREHHRDHRVTYRVRKGDDYEVRGRVLTVYFDKHEKYPEVEVVVVNRRKHDHDHYMSQL